MTWGMLIWLVYAVPFLVAGFCVLYVLRRWQAAILRREQSEEARGFPVRLTGAEPVGPALPAAPPQWPAQPALREK